MFDYMDGIMQAVATKKTAWKEALYIAVKLAWQKLSKYYAQVTPMTGKPLIVAHIVDLLSKLWSFWKCDKGMDINPEDKTSYTTQYHKAFLKNVKNEYCANHICVPVSEHDILPSHSLFPVSMASGSTLSYFHRYDLSSDDEESITHNN